MTAQLKGLFCILGLMLSTHSVAAQECALDINGDGRTTVDEILVSVNEALNGCPGSPPVSCPLDFNDNNYLAAFCSYEGSAYSSCGPLADEIVGWQSNGSGTVVVVFADISGTVGASATRTSATTALIYEISPGPDFDQTYSATGSVSLPSTTSLSANFDTSMSCVDITFSGTFVQMLGGSTSAQRQSLISAMKTRLERSDFAGGLPPNDMNNIFRRFWERAAIEGFVDAR